MLGNSLPRFLGAMPGRPKGAPGAVGSSRLCRNLHSKSPNQLHNGNPYERFDLRTIRWICKAASGQPIFKQLIGALPRSWSWTWGVGRGFRDPRGVCC